MKFELASLKSWLTWPSLLAAVVLFAAFAWSFAPVFAELRMAWDKEADYSHGYFVIPIAAFFLWARRGSFKFAPKPSGVWLGIALLACSFGIRLMGRLFYIEALTAWSLPIWVAGTVSILGGWAMLRWALPSVLFLWFMIPLPYRAEHLLSLPLQKLATKISCWLLVCCGQPALAEGNVILINDFRLEVAEACSGLRMFMSIAALAFAYAVVSRASWRNKLLLAASVIPIAVVANSLRIAATGLLYSWVSGEAARKFSHDFAGYAMIVVAAGMLALFLVYLNRLLIDERPAAAADLLRRGQMPHAT